MNFKILKVATRKSRLAICQAQYVCNKLKYLYPNIKTKLIPIVTTGDKSLDVLLNNKKIQRGAFIKELEYALIEDRADIAVHSMKDVTIPIPSGLVIPILCKRDDPRDVFVSLRYSNISALPIGATIGTSSLRRKCQLLEKRSDLLVKNLRGNVDTRLKTLYDNKYDAIILAAAGLHRLNLQRYIRNYIDPSYLLPAMGQGALAIECRLSDVNTLSLLSPLYHHETSLCIKAERAITTYLGSYCGFPIASYAEIKKKQIWLRALVGLSDGSKIIRTEGRASLLQAERLGFILAKNLLVRFKKLIKIFP